MPPISVGEGMNGDQTVTEADGALVCWKDSILGPVAGIIHQLPDLGGDPVCLNPDVARCRSIKARPLPYIFEHSAMKLAKLPVIECVEAARARSPSKCACNI